MSTKYYLRNSESNKETSITVRTRWKKQTLIYSTGIKIKPTDWNPRQERVRKSCNKYSEFNDHLEAEIKLIEKAKVAFKGTYGHTPTSKQFKAFLSKYRKEQSEENADNLTFDYFELVEDVAKQHDRRLKNEGKDISRNSVSTSHRQTAKVLREFQSSTGNVIAFDIIDLDFYYDFVDWCTYKKGYSVNNTGKHIKNIKVIMNEANERELTDNQKHRSKKFKVLQEEVDNVYLTHEELRSLAELDLTNKPHLNKARDLFLIGAYTGLRISDFKRIRKHHIQEDSFIRIEMSKTGNTVEIPMQLVLRKLLDSYDYNPPKMQDQKVNDYIKVVCELAGINETVTRERTKRGKKVTIRQPKYELVTSHTARRSFATNCFKDGLDSLTIMQITGHKTEKAFMKYIKATPSDYRERMRKHFNMNHSQMKIA